MCTSCQEVHAQVLEPLKAEYGDRLIIEERNIQQSENFDLLLDFEEAYQVTHTEIPEIVIGDEMLVGAEEIMLELRARVESYLAQGGVALPPPPKSTSEPTVAPEATSCAECDDVHSANKTAVASRGSAPIVYGAYFYQSGCDVCERAEHDLAYIQERYPQFQIRRFDVKEEALLNEYLSQRADVPEDQRLVAPALFVGDGYLVGDNVRARAIEALIQPYLEKGAPEPWQGFERWQEQAKASIVSRFQSFGLLTVMGAGLIDGVNPCAFATMIFLLSYLSVRKRTGRALLATGGAFSLGVFLTYLGVGFGFLRALASLSFLQVIGKWVYGLTALLCLGLAYGSLVDFRRARAGRLEEMSLKLPKRLQSISHRLIRRGAKSRRFVLSAFLLGLAVSLVELACTGQVYLPTIVFMLGIPGWKAKAGLALILYNVMFILPLIGVFLLVYFGTTSQQLLTWMRRHAATVKLAMATLFLLLAGWLIYAIVAF